MSEYYFSIDCRDGTLAVVEWNHQGLKPTTLNRSTRANKIDNEIMYHLREYMNGFRSHDPVSEQDTVKVIRLALMIVCIARSNPARFAKRIEAITAMADAEAWYWYEKTSTPNGVKAFRILFGD